MSEQISVNDVHWMMGALQGIDVGLIVVDTEHTVVAWNDFMENHSGIRVSNAVGANLFDLSPELPNEWLMRQLQAVVALNLPIYSTWQQRPYLFRFKSYRPITGQAAHMYQNITFLPLLSTTGEVDKICISVYDATQAAVNELNMTALNKELIKISRTDRMTGLFNRGHWEEMARREFKRCLRYGHISTLVMFDIDHFKGINDNFGHQIGDEVIKSTATLALSLIRESDMAGRYGGEEFAVILCDTDQDGAEQFCERIRKEIEGLSLQFDDHSVSFTISLGYAQIQSGTGALETWIKQADAALYHSKANGRNCTHRYDPDRIKLPG